MSFLKTIKTQLGISNTPANNFVLDASAADGSMKVSRGNIEGTSEDVITIDAAGKVAFPKTFDKLVAFGIFDGTVVGTHSFVSSFGCNSVTRNSAGNYTILLSNTYSDNFHIVTISTGAEAIFSAQWISATTNSITLGNYNSGGSHADGIRIMFSVYRATP